MMHLWLAACHLSHMPTIDTIIGSHCEKNHLLPLPQGGSGRGLQGEGPPTPPA